MPRASGRGAFPLVFTHGWPGSFWEVHKIIGPLTDPAAHGGDPADAFDLIAPSLPGYGFSPHPGTPGITPTRIADLIDTLMVDVLGYPRYVAQGGDWGAAVTTALGREHGDQVAAIHLNLMSGTLSPEQRAEPLTAAEQEYLDRLAVWRTEGSGYGHIQGTRPSTLGAGLSDSPAGLAAWIVEKFRAWSDCDGDVESVFSKDELLTNITLYWLTNTIASSTRLYYEAQHADAEHRLRRDADRVRVLRQGDQRGAEGVGGARLQRRPLHRVRPGRPLRGTGTAGRPGHRDPRVLPPVPGLSRA